MKLYYVLAISVAFTFCSSCKDNKTFLVIQNVSVKDSLLTIIRVNNQVVFNDVLPKALTEHSFMQEDLWSVSPPFTVDVEIPALGLKKSRQSDSSDVSRILVTIYSTILSLELKDPNKLSSVPRKEEILIGFYEQE